MLKTKKLDSRDRLIQSRTEMYFLVNEVVIFDLFLIACCSGHEWKADQNCYEKRVKKGSGGWGGGNAVQITLKQYCQFVVTTPLKQDSDDESSSQDYWSIVMVVLPLWVIYTCCTVNPLTDYVLDAYVKTLIEATWIDLLGATDLFTKLGVSSLDICQCEFVCKVNSAQQLDAEWDCGAG